VHFFSHAVLAVLRFDNRLVEKMREIINMSICPQDHVAAAPAIPAIWSALRHKFLAPKTHASTAAIARLRKHFDSIDEHVSGEVEALDR
jgi:hypothetical protein